MKFKKSWDKMKWKAQQNRTSVVYSKQPYERNEWFQGPTLKFLKRGTREMAWWLANISENSS